MYEGHSIFKLNSWLVIFSELEHLTPYHPLTLWA